MNIFITRRIPESGITLLKKKGYNTVIYPKDKKIPRKDLLRGVQGADAILSLLTDRMDDEVLEAAGAQLKMVANYAVGFDNVDLKAAKQRGIIVTNTPSDKVTEAVAEHAVALIFGLAHRMVEADAFTRAGKYHGWGPKLLLGTDVMGKTLGIIGAGRIGSAIARRLHNGFGVNIIYNDIQRNPDMEKSYKARFRSKTQLLKEADFISLHVPLLPATRHLIGAKELKAMKKTAFLINTSRGPVVDELALVKALAQSDIGGAGLDVYECEPFIDCNPKDTYELRKMKNVILTPHTASATREAREEMSTVAAKNIVAVLSGKKPLNPAR